MDIVNIEHAVNFKEQNVIFVDGLTIDRVRMRYNWLLNACVRDAIIGEDQYGLVWYFGDWLCGEWLDGTWYSGRFFDGVWYNGFFHSYKLNKFDILNNKMTIESINNASSQFYHGIWENGDFYEGTFGNDQDTQWNPEYTNDVAIWKYGRFHNGLFVDSLWYKGVFNAGYMKNSQWFNGDFFNGSFFGGNTLNQKSNWFKGNFYGGDFLKGIWHSGLFTKANANTTSRFGYTTINELEECLWITGTFKNADFYSGTGCTNHGVSRWLNGTFEGGIWHGGSFEDGTWINGTWLDGVFGTNATQWIYPTVVWQTGATSAIDWQDIKNLEIGYLKMPAYIEYPSGFSEGFATGKTLCFSGFSFGFVDLDLSNITIEGIEIEIERSGYYDHFTGGLVDLQINLEKGSTLTTVSGFENNIPYSYNNSYNKETVFYGSRTSDWNVSVPFVYSDIDQLVVTYTPKIKYYHHTQVTGYTYQVAAKVYYSTKPIWMDGTWYNGVWYCGTFKHGKFKKGMTFGGVFEDVDMS